MIRAVVNFRALLRVAVSGDIGFHADNRLNPGFFGLFVEFNQPVHDPMIGQSDGRHAKFLGFGHQAVNLRQAIKQRIMRVDVEVDEGHRLFG